jgi:hypothetical protein
MNRIMPWIAWPILVLSPLAAGAQSAGATTGPIEGIVRDAAGNPLSAVFLTAFSAMTMRDSAGRFLRARVPAGSITPDGKSVAVAAVGDAVDTAIVTAGQTAVESLTVRSPVVIHPQPNPLHPSTPFVNPGTLISLLGGLVLLFFVYARPNQRSTSGPSIAVAGPLLLVAWPALVGLWGMLSYESEENLGRIGWHSAALLLLALCWLVVAAWTFRQQRPTARMTFLRLLAVWSLLWTAFSWLFAMGSITNDWL